MNPRFVRIGVAAAAAAVGFLLQQVLGNRGSKNGSSLGDRAGRLRDAAAKPMDKVEDLSHDGREMLDDLGRRVSSRFGGGDGSETDDGGPSLDELAARRKERKERRRRRGSRK
jgi:hypothetical protein